MDNYRILNIINLNCYKLFTECKNGDIFVPPHFNTSKDIDALIILNQIVNIISDKRNIILNQIVCRIVFIKCREFTKLFNVHSDNFYNTFLLYIESIANLEDHNMIID